MLLSISNFTVIFSYPLFGCFIIFMIWLSYERKKSTKKELEDERTFWNKEQLANSTRRVDLDSIEYIKIPIESFPFSRYEDKELHSCEEVFLDLNSKNILNITGKTSTQLKLEYGPANLDKLNELDENFILLVKTLYSYGCRLHELGHDTEAIKVLEFGIDILSDISGNYKLLATLYISHNTPEKIDYLIDSAEKLDSLMKNSILRTLNNLKESTLAKTLSKDPSFTENNAIDNS